MNWISVNISPEDHNDVLCVTKTMGGKFVQFVGNYTKGHEIEFWEDDYDGDYDEVEDKNGTLYLKPGWYELEETPGGDYDEVWLKRNPTHWMPLPEPPKE